MQNIDESRIEKAASLLCSYNNSSNDNPFLTPSIVTFQNPPLLRIESTMSYGIQGANEQEIRRQRRKLVMQDSTYMAGIQILEALGAKQEDIASERVRNDKGAVTFAEGTLGGNGSRSMYDICTFSVPLDKLDKNIIDSLLSQANHVKTIGNKLNQLFSSESNHGYCSVHPPLNIWLHLGGDEIKAMEKLQLVREAVDKALQKNPADMTVDDIIPAQLDQDNQGAYVVGISLHNRIKEAGIMEEAADIAVNHHQAQKIWAKEQEIHASGVDESIAKMPQLFSNMGFEVASVKRIAGTTDIKVEFTKEHTPHQLEGLANKLYFMLRNLPKSHGVIVKNGRHNYVQRVDHAVPEKNNFSGNAKTVDIDFLTEHRLDNGEGALHVSLSAVDLKSCLEQLIENKWQRSVSKKDGPAQRPLY